MKPYARGLVVQDELVRGLVSDPKKIREHFPLYLNGRDVAQTPRGVRVIDLFGMDEERLRQEFPAVYQYLLTHVKPERDVDRDPMVRQYWWLFQRNRPELRDALMGLKRYIVTVENSPERYFAFVDAGILPDQKLRVVASDDALVFGLLCSRAHNIFSARLGGRQGVANTPVYNTRCFTMFPMPVCSTAVAARIRVHAEAIHQHRKTQQVAHAGLALTDLYNVLRKVRAAEELNSRDATIHEKGLVSVLKKIHDDLDAAVFDAYGWPHDLTDEQILEKLVALNAERAEEEKQGTIRWLRPDFQNPTGKQAAVQATLAGTGEDETEEPAAPAPSARPWPKKLADQIGAVRDLITGSRGFWTSTTAAAAFSGARPADVAPILESLATLGLLLTFESEDGPRWKAVKSAP